MTQDHEAIEELLAGYVLRGLSGEDAAAADRLLVEHVPSCPMCRDTLAALQEVAGDLALAPEPAMPPDVLLPRMRAALEEEPVRSGRRSFSLWIGGVAAVVVLGLAGWNVVISQRVSDIVAQRNLMHEAVATASLPGSSLVSLGEMVEVAQPGHPSMYLIGRGVPPPAPGHVYRLWLGGGGSFTWIADFVPDADGLVVEHLPVDVADYDEVWITEEPAGEEPSRPGGATRWQAVLPRAA